MTEADDAPILTISQVTGIITRGRWWILLGMCVSAVVAIAAAYFVLPVRYTSEATLLVVQQQVPERYVTPTSTLTIGAELQAMTQEVLSRKRLLELIDQFGLYAKERQRLAPEEIITLMRKYIDIEPIEAGPGALAGLGGKDFNAFKISFSADKAVLAQEVTSQLTSLFIQENLKVRDEQATTTTNFLDEHVDAAKKRLSEQEERLRDFKMQNLGTLPEQQQGNVAILGSAQVQLQNTSASLDRARQQQAYLESLLEAYRRLAARGLALPSVSALPGRIDASGADDPIQVLQKDLNRLKIQRTQLLSVYNETYPDVANIDREIAAKQASLEALKSAKSAAANVPDDPKTVAAGSEKGPAQTKTSAADSEEDTSVAQVKSQLEANKLEIENLAKAEKQENATIAEYQSRLNLTPVREQQLSGILRDYELSKQEYQDLLGKEQQSQLAMSLEKRQGGQQFRLAESPSLPTLPSSPKRLKIALGGAGVGILLGLVLAVLMEFKAPKLYDENDVIRRFATPLVVGLPLLLEPGEKRRRRWKRIVEWFGGSLLTAGVLAAEYFVYLHP